MNDAKPVQYMNDARRADFRAIREEGERAYDAMVTEIAALRREVERLKLTDEEREVVSRQADFLEAKSRSAAEINLAYLLSQDAATLRSLLQRLGGTNG